MKKKLLSLALVLAMALTLLPTAAFAAETAHNNKNGEACSGTLTWTKDASGHSATCSTGTDTCDGIA